MADYRFEGRTSQGQEVTGTLHGASADAVAGQLVGRGVTPIKIVEVSIGDTYLKSINAFLGAEKVPTVDLIMFSRQMYTITKAGVPLTRGLRGLAASVRHEHFREVLIDVADRLETGVSLSQAMGNYPKVFNSLFISLINVGENSGALDDVFRQIGFYMERDEETKKQVKAAMRYPSFVMVALVIAVTAVNIMVIPAFANMFEQFGAELPLMTKMLIGMSHVFVHYGWFLLVGTIVTVVGTIYYIRTPNGAYLWGRYKLKLPVVGGLIERASMARYSRSFSLMLGAGVPVTRSLDLCGAALDNSYLDEKVRFIREGIERGESLLNTHIQAQIFTPLVLQMVAVGEESGQVEELLAEVAEFYEREVDYDLKTLTSRIEPILIITMAVFVAVLALGIFVPMWSMHEVQG
ncbi:MAG: MSHA biogenesis protein MshG [Alteromonadaceae bacterium]|nr:MAG: MSHA biogenesis protein MshG [Alteromonadaceae bacterium]